MAQELCGGVAGGVGGLTSAALHFFAAAQCLLGEAGPPHAHPTDGSHFDFIVVGGGSAGCAVAARLAETRAHVLLVEAGPDPPPDAVVPGFRDVLKSSPYDWNFTTVNDGCTGQSLAGGRQRQPRGKMLGGSGSLNDMVYARGHPTDYDEWASLAGDDWSWASVLEYFKRTEHNTDENIVNNPELMRFHGRDGEIEVTGTKAATFTTRKFLDAFAELGFEMVDDMTYPNKIGAGRFSHTIRNGRRESTLTALLNRAYGENLHVTRNALATKILVQNKTAVGVKLKTDDEEMVLFADKEVILSAGTFNTAKLMLLSGIGPKTHLDELDIEVVQDLPVGSNLHDHVMVVSYLAAEPGTCVANETAQYFEMIKYLYDSTGELSFSDSMAAYIPRSGGRPDVQHFALYPSCVPLSTFTYEGCIARGGYSDKICKILHAENRQKELITVAVVLLKPKSRGKVRLKSADPREDPLIFAGTFSNGEDFVGYAEAMKVAWSIVETSYFREKKAYVVDLDIEECSGLADVDFIRCQVRNLAMSAWHSVGTAAMGAVVDAQLRVFGVAGLRVADASVMPEIVRGNTNAPVVMIAEKAAAFIKRNYDGLI